MRRQIKMREIRSPKLTVIGEGLTEMYYAQHLRNIRGYSFDCKPRFYKKADYKELHGLIGRITEEGGDVVCLFDADVTRNDPTRKKEFERLFQDYGCNEKVILCDSMPSIEFWFLLHFVKTSKYYKDSDVVIKDLKQYLKAYNKTEKYLQNEAWPKLLFDNLETAIRNAIEIGSKGESYSNVFKAFKRFEQTVRK